MEGDELYAQLAEIDENLMRHELTATQQAEHLERRGEIWKSMKEAESAKESGTSCPTLSDTGRGNKQFAQETSEATGVDKRSVNRATRRAREVCQQARDIIRGTKADTGVFLDQLAKLDSDDAQVEAAQDKIDAIKAQEENAQRREEEKARSRLSMTPNLRPSIFYTKS